MPNICQGTPAAAIFSEVCTALDPNPQAHLNFIRYRMDQCKRTHKLCCAPLLNNGEKPEMPTRLIDLGVPEDSKAARLIITASCGVQAPYLALSYCWGTGMQSTICLRDNNFEQLQLCIDEHTLPKTHKDTFQLARDLGFRYVWIDALCIIQGNHEDWAYQSTRMSHVYGNAALTIIAGRAMDCREGFLENRWRPAADPCAIPFCYEASRSKLPYPVNGASGIGHIWVSLNRKVTDGPVDKRGWCFQEKMLSQRMLVFGEEQLNFTCSTLRIWEDGEVSRPGVFQIRNNTNHKYSKAGLDPKILARGLQEVSDEEQTRRWLIFWYNEVQWHYASKDFTSDGDVFAAISGVAQMMKPKIRSRYLAGIWEVDMVRGLLWTSYSQFHPRRRKLTTIPLPKSDSALPTQVIPPGVPSWSWVAIQGRSKVHSAERYEMKYDESNWLVRPNNNGRWTRDTACHATAAQIHGCQLEFFGRPRRTKCLRRSRRGTALTLTAVIEDGDSHGPGDPNHVVAEGMIDIREDIVDDCWSLALTRKEGLVLARDEDGRFRRIGIMTTIKDLEWMMSAPEEEVYLI